MSELPAGIRLETVPCNACGSTTSEPLWSGHDRLHHTPGKFTSVRCVACGLVYVNPRPVLEDTHVFYPENYRPYQVRSQKTHPKLFWKWVHTQMWKRPLRQLYASPPPGGKLLEVGCGTGSFLVEAQQLGWNTTGVEISDRAVERARDQNLDVRCGTLDTVELTETFDLIRLSFVLEHVHDPLKTLRTVRRLLKPQGYAHIAAPNVDSIVARLFGTYWYDLDMPRHLYEFSPSTIRLLCEKADLLIVKAIGEINTYVFWASINHWLADKGVPGRIAGSITKWGSKLALPLAFSVGWVLSKQLRTSRLHFVVTPDEPSKVGKSRLQG
jgi:SAM-dependent methyltransferase